MDNSSYNWVYKILPPYNLYGTSQLSKYFDTIKFIFKIVHIVNIGKIIPIFLIKTKQKTEG